MDRVAAFGLIDKPDVKRRGLSAKRRQIIIAATKS
jgi:hypothetical protein